MRLFSDLDIVNVIISLVSVVNVEIGRDLLYIEVVIDYITYRKEGSRTT